MKRFYILLIALLTSTVAVAQEPITYNFSTRNGGVIWQYVYEAPIPSEQVLNTLVASGYFCEIMDTADGISCRILPRTIDCVSSGFTRMSAPIYIANGMLEAHAIVQVKEGRYRVTVDGITTQIPRDKPTRLELYALRRNGEFKDGFFNAAAIILDNNLFSLFDVTTKLIDDNWQ